MWKTLLDIGYWMTNLDVEREPTTYFPSDLKWNILYYILFLKFLGFLFHALIHPFPAVTSFTGLPSIHPI